jgi:Mg2+-importing ATPase
VSVPDTTAPYWSRDVDDLSTSLGSGSNGLTAARAAEQLAVVGPNSVEDAQRLGPLRLLWRQVESPLVLILIFAAALSLSLSEWVDAAIILAIVIGSTLLGFYQEYRASAAVEELKKRLALTCRVVRDGVEGTVRADVLVPGDVLVLSAGNLIPADGRILEARDFLVSEASMTGESFPVEKQPGVVPADTPLARANECRLFSARRCAAARRESWSLKLGGARRSAPSPHGCARGSRKPTSPADFGSSATVDPGNGRDRPFRPDGESPAPPSARRVAALLSRPRVGLSPELLPAIVSVTLAAGARAMSKQGVIVRRLDAIENLGA